jgi:uncharacterized membrane protein YkgB
MICGSTCGIALMFLIANIYVTLSSDSKLKIKENYYKTLSRNEILRYENIVNERRNIYFQGYGLGLIMSFILLALNYNNKNGLSNNSMMCVVGAVTLTVNYFYYMLAPKSDYMVLHLNKREQREEWQKINRYMQVKYHVGLLLGIVAAMLFAKSCK